MLVIDCPEGKIKLPIDLWYCKLTNKACPLQASINTENWEHFFQYCLAPKDRQEGIQKAIASGKYKGFHHMVGRYLCPTCKIDRKAYHYPWELEQLKLYVPYDDETLRREIIKRGIPVSAISGSLCRSCLNDILSRLGLPSIEQQSIQNSGYGEPMNNDESISFQIYMSVIEKEGGGNPIEGNCSWCGNSFSWNTKGESIYYDIYSVMSSNGNRDSFRLCETCGDRFVMLFHVT